MPTPKIDHKPFLNLAARITRLAEHRDRIVLTTDELSIVTEHIGWFKAFMDQRRYANRCIKRRGSNRRPDNEIQPKSLRRRELRAIRVIKKEELDAKNS